ncbi:MAG: M23 family metallopeptidase [Candidatus Rifleibacteriota bacterium]
MQIYQLSNKARILLIIFSLLLLQLNVPVWNNLHTACSADFICYQQNKNNSWQNLNLLNNYFNHKLKSCLNHSRIAFNLPDNLEEFLNQPVPKSFKIVKVKSTKTTKTFYEWPVNGWVSSGFGMRRHPVTRRRAFHTGIDIAARKGTHINAPVDGKVVSAGRSGFLGRMVKIKTNKGLYLYFGHLKRIKCKNGQRVKKGQLIGTVGISGRSTGPHLHFSVKERGKFVNPLNYLSPL